MVCNQKYQNNLKRPIYAWKDNSDSYKKYKVRVNENNYQATKINNNYLKRQEINQNPIVK